MADDWIGNVPPGAKLRAYVWWCGDDECNCEQARIQMATERNSYGMWMWKPVWEGPYHADDWGWGYDGPAPTTELNREAKRLRKHHNELYHRIEWPWDRNKPEPVPDLMQALQDSIADAKAERLERDRNKEGKP